MESIPTDLVLEIFLRLPSKSIERFRCLSKLWMSLLHRQYFTESFLTRSSARPSLLFAINEENGECCFFSCPQLQDPNEKSSLVVAADCHTKFSGFSRSYESGLIFLEAISYDTGIVSPTICNPNTGQYAKLPNQACGRYNYIGCDPIDKQFKVLSMANRFSEDRNVHQILTLGTRKLGWRNIHCPLSHISLYENICINGVLYYLADEQNGRYYTGEDGSYYIIVCFDIRSEKFKLIGGERFHTCSKLVNYKGKLGLIFCRLSELRVWVLEDVEKQVWSKYVYTFPKIQVCDPRSVYVAGVTAMGQIVLSMSDISKKPFYVFYFNPQDNTLHTVEIQGLEVGHWVRTYVEHVEDLNASDAKLFRSRISVPSVKNRTTSSGRGKRNTMVQVGRRNRERERTIKCSAEMFCLTIVFFFALCFLFLVI